MPSGRGVCGKTGSVMCARHGGVKDTRLRSLRYGSRRLHRPAHGSRVGRHTVVRAGADVRPAFGKNACPQDHAQIYGQERPATHDFASYVVQDGSGLLVRLLATDSAFLDAEGIWWNPTLDDGRRRGEVREDLSNAEMIQWFLLCQMTAFDRRDLWPTTEERRRHLERFVVPAIAPGRAR